MLASFLRISLENPGLRRRWRVASARRRVQIGTPVWRATGHSQLTTNVDKATSAPSLFLTDRPARRLPPGVFADATLLLVLVALRLQPKRNSRFQTSDSGDIMIWNGKSWDLESHDRTSKMRELCREVTGSESNAIDRSVLR
jgi:hypothetical protein